MNIKGEHFKIMLDGQVIGTAQSGMLPYIPIGTYDNFGNEIEPKHEESSKSWDILCNALVTECDIPDPLNDMIQGPQLMDVKIERPIGKMPRKMKKADKRDPYGKTKWGRKAINCRRRHTTILNDAEIVITKQDQETLTATITKAMEKPVHCARVSGDDIKRAMERYCK